jgi:flagellar biosynthesis GTPase FlhF
VVARIERTAAYTRTGYHSSGGTGQYRDAAGVAAAIFIQHTSRDGDPQLHAHTAVLNRAQRADGADAKYRTLHSRALYQERLDIAAHGARVMASKLADLGYLLIPRADGNGFEIGGVNPEVMAAFSSRRAAITPEVERMAAEYRQVHGREPNARTLWAMKQHATLASRKAKAHGRAVPAPAEQLAEWEAKTTAREVQALSDVHRAVAAYRAEHADSAPGPLTAVQRARAIRVAVAEVQRHHAAWTRAQLAFELHRALPALPAGVDQAAVLDDLVAEALAGRSGGADVVCLGPAPDVTDVSELGVRASDGQSVYRPPGQERYTTAGQLDIEENLLAEARRKVPQAVSGQQAAAALAGTDLDEAQRKVAAGLLTSTRALSVLVAPAGTGKTHTLAANTGTSWIAGSVRL